MKKLLTLVLAAFIVAALAISVSANAGTGYTITASRGTPTVDGVKDDIWDTAEAQTQERIRSGEDTGTHVTIRFLYDGSNEEFIKKIKSMGLTPLPDELRALRDITNEDKERYQTIYAKVEGAVAAPTAGLHISRELMKRFEIKDVKWAELTVHAGIGNFKSIEVEDLSKHRQDSEEMIIDEECCNIINNAKRTGHKICCIGTTTMKAIETAVTIPGKVSPYEGWTNKFIYPPYDFTIADMMVSNFHPSMSSMFIMVSAFGGPDFVMQAYQTAIKEKYRFSTYGDAMLIV